MRRKREEEEEENSIQMNEKKHLLASTHGHHKFSDNEKGKMASYQSLDFAVMDNQILHEYNRKNTKKDFIISDIGKWIICFWIGVIVGVVAYAIKFLVETLNEYKYDWSLQYIQQPGYSFGIFAGINLSFTLIACGVILLIRQPLAGSSGLPEVKGYLNGVRIANSLNIKTLIGKLISLIFAFSASLILGPEGPMIHIGSMIGAAVGQLKSKTLKFYPKIFWRYHNDRDRRDFISAGAAAGVAAAFGAPIGGVLFSIEEASSFWSPELTWRTFFTCLCASLTVSAFQNGMDTVVKNHGMIFFGLSQNYLYQLPEIAAFAVLGAIGGAIGAFYVYLNVKLNRFRSKKIHPYWILRLLEAVVLSLITSGMLFGISFAFPCVFEVEDNSVAQDCFDSNNQTLIQFNCPQGQYSTMGSVLFATHDSALRVLYDRHQHDFTLTEMGVACVAFFMLAVLTSGVLVAGGLFIPMMLIGATAGRFFGGILKIIFSHSPPDASVYALVGTASVMAGFSRMTISLAVIMVELTQSTQYLLPIILSVMISKWVADVFTCAYYENMMELKCIPYLHASPPQEMLFFSVAEIMRRDVVDFSSMEKVSDVMKTLETYFHGAFPVVDRGPHNNSHYFKGIVTRRQLLVLLKHRVFTSVGDDDQFKKDTNNSATVVHDTCSYTEAYRLFRTMGLRHLVVINIYNQVVGIITRKDLL